MRTIEHVLNDVKDRTVTFENCRKRILASFHAASGDLVETFRKIKLRDPVSFLRIDRAVRGLNCTHFQCFDRLTFLTINFRDPKFRCPVCDHPLPAGEIVADEFFQRILADYPRAQDLRIGHDAAVVVDTYEDDEEEVESEEKPRRNGAAIATPLQHSSQTPLREVPLPQVHDVMKVDLDEEPLDQSPLPTQPTKRQRTAPEIIELSDD